MAQNVSKTLHFLLASEINMIHIIWKVQTFATNTQSLVMSGKNSHFPRYVIQGSYHFLGWSKGGPFCFSEQKGRGPELLRIKEGGPNFFLKKFLLLMCNSFLDSVQHFTLPYFMFIYNHIHGFVSTPDHSPCNLITAPFIIYVRGVFFQQGWTRIFSQKSKGGPECFCVCKGDTRKIGDRQLHGKA